MSAPPGAAEAGPGRPPRRPYWLGVALILLGAVWLRGALALPGTATYAVVGPGLFPALVGGALVLLGLLLLLAVRRGERFEPQETEDADPTRPPSRRALWMTAAAGILPVATMRPLGFPVTAALVFALTARAFGSGRPVRDLAAGLALGAGGWLLFSRLLGLSLPAAPFLFGR